MSDHQGKYPECFGDMDTVFPMEEDGLRQTPEDCLPCPHKTDCLRTAVSGPKGHTIRHEMVDRAYTSGRMTFWQRWSRKKTIEKKKQNQ